MKKIFFLVFLSSLALCSQAFNPTPDEVREHEKGCSLHNSFDCLILGEIFEKGTENTAQDLKKAFYYYNKSCSYGEADGCSSLGYLYETGSGVEADPDKALKLYTKSCKKEGLKGCFLLGKAYDSGALGLKKDPKKALENFERACNNDYAEACSFAADHYATGEGVAENSAKALELYEAGCMLGDDVACEKAKGKEAGE